MTKPDFAGGSLEGPMKQPILEISRRSGKKCPVEDKCAELSFMLHSENEAVWYLKYCQSEIEILTILNLSFCSGKILHRSMEMSYRSRPTLSGHCRILVQYGAIWCYGDMPIEVLIDVILSQTNNQIKLVLKSSLSWEQFVSLNCDHLKKRFYWSIVPIKNSLKRLTNASVYTMISENFSVIFNLLCHVCIIKTDALFTCRVNWQYRIQLCLEILPVMVHWTRSFYIRVKALIDS